VMLKRILRALAFWRHNAEPEPLTEEQNQLAGNFDQPRSLLLWGAGREDGSEVMIEWLREIESPPDISRHSVIGKTVTRNDIAQSLEHTIDSRRVKVFCGHGSEDALLGSPYDGCQMVTLNGESYSVLFDATMISDHPSALFAFCCKSASKLGNDFVSPGGRTFLGYAENIGYDLSNEECQQSWKNIITRVAEEIVKDGEIKRKHLELLNSLYDEAIEQYMYGAGKNNDRALDMAMYLLRHQKYMRRL
jgi:hypothetical protein